ncbi:MAG: sulfite exporter TauE/SafE family protein [Verrucomicrobiales bacterium]|nr:sulfite exporter TauE/SafE family protein [Verrucomicrobiales bacterium]
MSILPPPKTHLWVWFLSLALFYVGWLATVVICDGWSSVTDHWPIALAMTLGSYAAGSTPMGGGTVGFPILVLLFDQPAQLGRDFSFAVQSVGMTSASIFILARRQPLATAMLKGTMLGTLIGTPLGIFLIAPFVTALWIKLVFATVWASFGILHLWRIREIAEHEGMTDFDERWDARIGFAAGFLSGATIVSLTGVGIDMVLYTILVLLCRADLRIAISTSVVAMAFASLVGIATKAAFTGIQPGVFAHWLAAAPVVAIGAPLGVFAVSLIGRKPTLVFVAVLCITHYLWICYVERANLGTRGIIAATVAVTLLLAAFEKLRTWGGVLVAGQKRPN